MKNGFRFLFTVVCLLINIDPSQSQWVQCNGASGTYVNCFAESGPNLYAATTTGVFFSTNNGASWNTLPTVLTNTYISSVAVIGTDVFAGTNGGGVYRSVDSGKTWSAVNAGLTNTNVFALAGSGANLFAGTKSGVSYSTNNGTNWIATKEIVYVNAFAVSGPTIIAACNGSIYYTSNYDGVWNLTVNGVSPYVNGFAVSGNELFSATPAGVWRSKIDVPGWTLVGTGLSTTDVAGVAVFGTKIFAGTANGVFISTGSNTSWTAANTGLPNIGIRTLFIFGTNLFAGTKGGGIWKRPLAEMTTLVDNNSTRLPAHFNLSQNFPNPFNPSTTISFSLPTKSFVSLKVFDMIGREVATLASEEMSAGSYSRHWNALGFLTGVYFYRLQTGAYAETKRIVLLK